MSVARVQVALERDSLLPADRVVNTLHYEGLGDFFTDADAVTLAEFVRDRFIAIMVNFGAILNGAGTVSVYDLGDPKPRAPKAEVAFSGAAVGADSLPGEVAVCLSFQAANISGVPQARRRGRLYLGPLNETMLGAPANGEVRPTAGIMTAIADWGLTLTPAGGVGLAEFRHAVYSPRSQAAGATLESATALVTRYWVDDAFDIQRRRGAAPTSRTERLVVA